ncbi:MAG TPA: ABC transporter permease [Stellaceae bacterium]|nr:ABC transporter permease [Stellaceae bacterium]
MTGRFDLFAATRWVPWLFTGLVLFFLAAPLFVVVPAAFNNSSLLQFPPRAWSLRWFHQYFDNPSWIEATLMSVKVGICVSLLATLLGLASAVGLARYRLFGRNLLRALVMAPLLVPVIVIAVGLYELFLRLGINGSFAAIVIGHTLVTFPYATVVIGAALAEIDPRLENAAVGLGARRPRAFLEVTLPLIRPGLVVAALFGFLISFDEVVLAIFLTSPATMTLPRRLWDGIRFELNPTIAAVSTMLIVLSTVVMLLSEVLRRVLARRSGLPAGQGR